MPTDPALRRWAVASLVVNKGIVVTGALARLTDSGLGCPTRPECEPGSYVPLPESGMHPLIEFGNRLLTFVLAAVALGTAVSAWRSPAGVRLRVLSIAVGLGIVTQAVIGGVSVLAQLNPWIVGLHMIVSVALIMLCVAMVHRAYYLAPLSATPVQKRTIRALFAVGLLVMWLGVVVTGAGPNAGDGGAQRNGLGLEATARVHALATWVLVALTWPWRWLATMPGSGGW